MLTLAILLCHPEGWAKYLRITGKQGFHEGVYNYLLHEAIYEITESPRAVQFPKPTCRLQAIS